MNSLLDIQRKENIYTNVLESSQDPERAVNNCQEEQQTFPRACSRQSPVSSVDASCGDGLMLGSPCPCTPACGNTKHHLLLGFMSSKTMDSCLSDPAVLLFDLSESKSFLSWF